jgi:3-methyl-2-oxobutanoate hydroxymethyltransferase
MSLTESRLPAGALPVRVTAQTLLHKKRNGEPITAITAADYPTARLVDEAGIDLILVGDSLAMATLGQTNTLSITMDEMLHHARAVARGASQAFLVGDMPYGSYQVSETEAVGNALRFIREAGMAAVKLEGAHPALTARLTAAEIQVVGHLGLTPQSVHRMGGYKVQARTLDAVEALLEDALALEHAGAVALVLEGIPREVAERITRHLEIPTIGIGAGPGCDGQILVFHDAFNLTFTPGAKFVRRFADAAALFREGLAEFRESVATRTFPADAESYHLPAEVAAALEPLVKV